MERGRYKDGRHHEISRDKATAEHHGLQARISSWRTENAKPSGAPAEDPELQMAKPKLEPVKLPGKFPDMPWKKKPEVK